MTIFRVGPYSYFGDPAIRAGCDQGGIRMFASALRSARSTGHARFDGDDGVQHQIEERAGAADIGIGQRSVTWRLDTTKLEELIELVDPLIVDNKSGHQYLDIKSPTETLVVSVNEFPQNAIDAHSE